MCKRGILGVKYECFRIPCKENKDDESILKQLDLVELNF
jgi:hypothetical protein